MSALLGFPNPVNEKAARTVAFGVLLLSALIVVTGWLWLSVPLAYGFLARVASGPRFSALGQLATRVIAPQLGPAKLVAGPPKRFAQAIGSVLSVLAAATYFALGWTTLPLILAGLIIIAAFLESIVGYCIGCAIFGALMRLNVIPESICLDCGNISARLDPALAAGSSDAAGSASI
jgi:hypothetical protein